MEEAVRELNQLQQYFEEWIPQVIGFAVNVLLAFILFFIGRLVIKALCRFVKKQMERTKSEPNVIKFIGTLLRVCLYAFLIFLIAQRVGVSSSATAAVLGAGGVAIGLALQGSLSNFAGGVLILILKPFVVGDYIIEHTRNNEGVVQEISVFYTRIITVDNKTIIIPNGMLSNTSLTNVTERPERQLDLKIHVSYETDLSQVKEMLEGLLRGIPEIIQEEGMKAFVDALEQDVVVIGLRAWVKTVDYTATRCKVLEQVKVLFEQNGIARK
ncbi:MAG: mechanosensitive ion channel [Lachnospiraceae bacterium]|nr:mechanosensitive ion channel [Lachnospiraceae bacterium]